MLTMTLEEIREYNKYCGGTWPEDSPKYGVPVKYGHFIPGEPYYNVHGGQIVVAEHYLQDWAPKQLIYAIPEPKYRFVCDEPHRRDGKEGEYWAKVDSLSHYSSAVEFKLIVKDQRVPNCLIFRREEIK